jgi:phage baseplate assembly protein W
LSSSRLGTTYNLPKDGTYDLLMIDFQNGFPEGMLKFDINETPRKITGVQKVAQMFLKLLFTSQGSNVLSPNQGTNFSMLINNSNISEQDSVFLAELNYEVRSAESQVKRIMNIGADLASQLDSITILGLDTTRESVIMYLRLITAAGVKAQVAIPFPELDLKLSEA